MGCDGEGKYDMDNALNFNPRTHRGVRLCVMEPSIDKDIFQSTHPSWGATLMLLNFCSISLFQSTHPSWGATLHRSVLPHLLHMNFNPRTHRGVRLLTSPFLLSRETISIHAPIVGCDGKRVAGLVNFNISIHAPIVGCDSCFSIALFFLY